MTNEVKTEVSQGHIEELIAVLATRIDDIAQVIWCIETTLTKVDEPGEALEILKNIMQEPFITNNLRTLTGVLADMLGQLNGILSYTREALGTKKLY